MSSPTDILATPTAGAGGPFVQGELVRVSANGIVVKAQADSAPNLQGYMGVVASGSVATGGPVNVVTAGARDLVHLEAGLTPVAGQTLYISAIVAGRATNVAPGTAVTVGVIEDASPYANTGRVWAVVSPASGGGGGGTGAQGAQGAQGSAGGAGAQGATGNTGAQGAQGFQGFQGAQGAQGVPFGTGLSTNVGSVATDGVSGFGARADHTHGALTADWTIANVRYYAVDAAGGSNANAGFSDVSAAAAWAVRKQTAAALGAIVPKFGNGRKIVIMIGGGGQTYTDAFELIAGQMQGYAGSGGIIRVTSTNATAQAVAGTDDIADATFSGAVTATGMNAAGYNPTGTPTTTRIQCVKVGGGAPGFAAEPALPVGARIRFDNSAGTATQASLRNVCRMIVRTVSSDTLQAALDSAFPVAPVATDTFYIEMPGANFGAVNLMMMGSISPQITGINFTGNAVIQATTGGTSALFMSFCSFSSTSAFRHSDANFNRLIAHPVLGNVTNGGCRTVGAVATLDSNLSFSEIVSVGLVTLSNPTSLQMTPQSAFLGGIQYEGGSIGINDANNFAASRAFLGSVTTTAPIRFKTGVGSAAIDIRGGRVNIAACVIVAGSQIGVSFHGTCDADLMAIGIGTPCYVQGEDGAVMTDVGLDLNSAAGVNASSLTRLRIGSGNTSNIAGVSGEIRLGSGQTITWVQANATGIVDALGNRIASGGSPPLSVIANFTGIIVVSSGGATLSYCGNAQTNLLTANNADPQLYTSSLRVATRLRVTVVKLTGSVNNAVTATVYQGTGGAAPTATAMSVSIPANSAARTRVSDTVHVLKILDGDTLDVRLDDATDAGAGTYLVSAVIEGPG